ncbi:hypothetical protein VPH35_095877 [Triticum aestivum]
MIVDISRSNKIIVKKFTVPVKTAKAIEKILAHNGRGVLNQILSNPEFLDEGTTAGSCFPKDILNLVYICECYGLPEVADYWRLVIVINDCQKSGFVNHVISSMFNTVAVKKVAMLGFAFKKDTGDTRETPAIDMCGGLLSGKAVVNMYDPQVTEEQVRRDLAMNKFDSDHPCHLLPVGEPTGQPATVTSDAYEAVRDAHAVCILTKWEAFRSLDCRRMYKEAGFRLCRRNIVEPAGEAPGYGIDRLCNWQAA